MPVSIGAPPGETEQRIREALAAKLPDAAIEVRGSGSHFEIRVVSAHFEGQSTLTKQRLVLGAIAHLMKGDNPPVHAIDRLETLSQV